MRFTFPKRTKFTALSMVAREVRDKYNDHRMIRFIREECHFSFRCVRAMIPSKLALALALAGKASCRQYAVRSPSNSTDMRGGLRATAQPTHNRWLQALEYVGSNPTVKMAACQGDCDDDGDCLVRVPRYVDSSNNARRFRSHLFAFSPWFELLSMCTPGRTEVLPTMEQRGSAGLLRRRKRQPIIRLLRRPSARLPLLDNAKRRPGRGRRAPGIVRGKL